MCLGILPSKGEKKKDMKDFDLPVPDCKPDDNDLSVDDKI